MEKTNLLLMILLVVAHKDLRNLFFLKEAKKFFAKITKRKIFFDFVKGLSILAVILIHVSFLYVISEKLQIREKFFVFTLNNLSRFAIGCFFITTGILLKSVNNRKEYLLFFKKRFFTILLPYILVSIIFDGLNNKSLFIIFQDIFTGKAAVPFYFVVIIFQFYLLYPLVLRYQSKFFLFISFIVSVCSFYIDFFWQFFGIPLFFQYFFFFVYGVYFREKFLLGRYDKKEKKTYLLLFLVYFFLVFVFMGYYFNIRLVYAVAVFNLLFIFFKEKEMKKNILGKTVALIGRYSLWIFLLHYPVLEFLFFYLNDITTNFYFNFFILFFTGSVISISVSVLVAKIYEKFLQQIKILN